MAPSAAKAKDIIPLYLADKIPLSSAIQFATQSSPYTLLAAVLKESRSLPRQIDTDPTTPTPDLPSPAQERLLKFVRNVQENLGQIQGSIVGYDELRVAMDMYAFLFEVGLGGNSGRGEQRDTGPLIDIDVNMGRNTHGNGDAGGELEDVFSPEATSATAPASGSGSSHQNPTSGTRRRSSSSSSGAQKHLFNLISFVSFLTKESLLLRPGVGERVAVEMIVETLEHPGIAPMGHELWFGNTTRSDFGFGSGAGSRSGGRVNEVTVIAISLWLIIMGEELYARARARARSQTRFQTATADSNGKGKAKSGCLIDLDDGSGFGGDGNGCAEEGTWSQLSTIVIQEWETWATRLQFLSLRQDLEIHAREQAAEAAAVMRRVYC